jgi:branched-subunit amino acid ABC-type transport system permease component
VGIVVGVGRGDWREFGQFGRSRAWGFLLFAIGVSLLLENGGQLTFGADPKFFPEFIPSRSLNVVP